MYTKYIKTISLKAYSQTLFLDKLRKINSPYCSDFKDINDAYSDFTEKVTSVIDEIAPIKEIRVKNYSQDWLDAETYHLSPITNLINDCKIAKLKPLYKK